MIKPNHQRSAGIFHEAVSAINHIDAAADTSFDPTPLIGLIAFVATKHEQLQQAYAELERTTQELIENNRIMRETIAKMAGREYLIRDLEDENKMLKLRLELDCNYRQPEI